MADTKSLFVSRTFWMAMLALAGFILQMFGVTFPESEQASLADQIVGIIPAVMEVVGILGAVWGRWQATTEVTLSGAPRYDPPMGGGVQ